MRANSARLDVVDIELEVRPSPLGDKMIMIGETIPSGFRLILSHAAALDLARDITETVSNHSDE